MTVEKREVCKITRPRCNPTDRVVSRRFQRLRGVNAGSNYAGRQWRACDVIEHRPLKRRHLDRVPFLNAQDSFSLLFFFLPKRMFVYVQL